MNWYYESQGQQQGPVSEAELDQLLASGRITPNTLVWREGMEGWAPLRAARSEATPGTVAPGMVRCDSCGNSFPPDEVVEIGGRSICANCKPAVVETLQQRGELPALAEGDRTGPPWEYRAELGVPKAAWETIKLVLGSPGATFSNMKRTGGLNAPLLYYVIVGSVAGIVGILWQVMFQFAGGIAGMQGQHGSPAAAVSGIAFMIMIGVWVILMPIFLAIAAFISSGITHLSLMICGGAKQPFETTFRVICYASASAASLQVVPVCGAIVGGVWGLVASCIGLSRAHEIGVGRALLAIILPTFVCIGLVLFFIFWAYGMAVATHHA